MIPVQPKLTESDIKYWGVIPSLSDWLIARIPKKAKVLEIGPGKYPFPRANVSVDFSSVAKQKGIIACDLNNETLPFEDKSFDFVYCRHVLEDMYNPFHACEEMSRVAKSGYVETPSPMAEMTRGIDGLNAPDYRGYHHHRYIIWANDGELHFVAKYPLIEYLSIDDAKLVHEMRGSPGYWNTYYLWDDEIKVKHHQDPGEYHNDMTQAINQSKRSAHDFWVNNKIPLKIEETMKVGAKTLKGAA